MGNMDGKVYSKAQRMHILNHELRPLSCRIKGLTLVISIGDTEPVLLQALKTTADELDNKIVKLIAEIDKGIWESPT
jgi:hypothetical protein